MATRSLIAEIRADGTVRAIYCHKDGYPEEVGRTLDAYYRNSTDVAVLIEGGDLSALGTDVSTCVYYHRDIGEPREVTEPVEFRSREELATNPGKYHCGIEWVYLFDHATEKWLVGKVAAVDNPLFGGRVVPVWRNLKEVLLRIPA